jgi:hypothetical protein
MMIQTLAEGRHVVPVERKTHLMPRKLEDEKNGKNQKDQ